MASISSWSIADFKSLGSATLALPHLTVLAGANSSGKSSVLQSILLLAQSITRGGNLVMNGPLVRLGEPADVVREGQAAVELRFTVQGGPPAVVEPPRALKFEVSLSLASSDNGVALVPSAFEVVDLEGTVLIAATSERMRLADIDAFSHTAHGLDLSFLRLTVFGGRKAPNRMYLGFLGVAPTLVARHIDPRVIVRQMESTLDDVLSTDRMTYELAQEVTQLVPKRKFFKEFQIEDQRESASVRVAPTPLWSKRDFAALDAAQRKELVSRAAAKRARVEWAVIGPGLGYLGSPHRLNRRYYFEGGVVESALADEHSLGLTFLGAFASAMEDFGGQVKYLGPLRDEPRVVQGAWDERVRALPVGIRGELTAEVLTREKDRTIRFNDWDGQPREGTLPDAAALWCNYFGIGERINVLDLGKLGRGVNLRVDGIDRDLTMIGVGASQLLPILVASLAAETGSLILIEQPELHLHPSVQSRLADFFLFARPDVRFIVETHSEYLVTRIRRRIAEERALPSDVEVMFAERRGGATEVRSLALGKGGDFNEWPEGFFDAQEIDLRYIVRAIASHVAKADS